ncbi:M14 family metallopeptidase [Subsaxibacter sp. CAU 1640]|uniref:M14 family metallopeptidase n=1 Tax=Subsaxibacter sp. CAU 1640 TaxID=2933271 RepID=UPI002004C17B|nr:M14 family metallopeptidase [Subsaxibacter sp. CAU 1640]MCK7590008.1 M14 family metallopeptidase [Subsaxibacter sp. CAU 1640]
MKKLFFAFIVIAWHTTLFFGQQITSPKDFLGYEVGTRFSRHHQVVDYFKKVESELPKQIKLEKYGETYEHRPLYVAYISSEENIKNLETIRENNLKNIGVIDGNSSSNDVAFVWLSYNVHGAEASSTEASMKTIYELLTKHQEWLKNTVVIIDPCLNPDGRDRYVNWYNQTARTPYDTNQQASESNQPWPGGRPNHYLFDLNRDWAWATQVESQSRLKIYNNWLPQIHVDFHEQGMNEPYYFAPAAEPFHEIISDWQRDFQTQIGKNNAKYFDENGWLYFTKERFDLLYPSYGDTYPTYLGAIGMTYEQAGQSGLGVLNDEGIVLTLVDRVSHHTVTGLSTIEIASQNAEKLNSEFKKYFDSNSNLKTKSYVLQGDKDKIESLKELLDQHQIKYGYASNGKISGYNYNSQNEGSINTTSADLVVSTNQPKGKMVDVLFEPQTKLVDSLTYDITAWSLPYAYGLNAVATNKLASTSVTTATPTLNSKNENAVAYLSKWNHLKDAKFLSELLKQNIKVRFTEKSFTTASTDQTFDRGSLIITRGDNSAIKDFDDKIIDAANKFRRIVTSVSSGFSKSGPDFGSPDVKLVTKPKIAILCGDYVSTLNYGELWHFFEQQLNFPVTSINTNDFKKINLNKYNILIIPNGYFSGYFDDDTLKSLRTWVNNGGKLIAIDGALKIFADKEGFNLKRTKSQDTIHAQNNLIPYAERERESAKGFIIGAIFKSNVDKTHPMAFGYDNSYFTLKLGSDSYSLLDNGYNIAWLGENAKSVSGFVGSNAEKNMKNTLLFGEENLGKGSIVYMVDNTLFRSFWENGKLFLANAIFFVNNNSFEL